MIHTIEESASLSKQHRQELAVRLSDGSSSSTGSSSSALVRQLRRRLAHVQLARHHVGNQARAVLLHQLDLAAGAGDGVVDGGCGLVKVFDDGALLGEEGGGEVASSFTSERRNVSLVPP